MLHGANSWSAVSAGVESAQIRGRPLDLGACWQNDALVATNTNLSSIQIEVRARATRKEMEAL